MSSVDVVIPCYKYAHFLPGCVESVLSQDRVDVRVLIIDDCSPDNTAEVGQRLAAADSRVTYVCNDVNSGLIKTANRGMIEWASADYSLLLSADDGVGPGALARAADLMDANPQVGMVYGSAMVLDGDQALGGAPEADSYRTMIVAGDRFLKFCCESGDQVPTPTAVVRTKLQHEIGGYSAEFPHTSDYEMWMRFALRGDIGVIDAVQAYWRRHGSNMSSALDYAGDLSECMRTVQKVATVHAAEIGDPQELLEIFRRRCANDALYEAHRLFEKGDASGADQYVAIAADQGVPLNQLATWRTLQAKRIIGARGFKAVQPVIDLLRGKARPAATNKVGAGTPGPELFGRWPTSPTTVAGAQARQPSP